MMRRLHKIFSVFFVILSTALSAQEINSVEFVQEGSYRFGKDILNFNVQSRKGTLYDERIVNEDIKRLYGTGFFADIRSEMKKREDGTIDLIFRVAPKDIVKSIIFEGNEKYSTQKLQEQVTLTVGAPLNDKRLSETISNLREFYRKEGLNDVSVYFSQQKNIDGGVDVLFKIQENLKLKVNSVTFTGATVFKPSELSARIVNRKSWFSWVPLLNLGLLHKRELDNDMIRLREAYWEKGIWTSK